jgi:hypothetical protein
MGAQVLITESWYKGRLLPLIERFAASLGELPIFAGTFGLV